jgi:hypothetical protein
MSVVQRVFGLPCLRLACSLESQVGSHRIAIAIQSHPCAVVATLRAHLHLRLRCIVIQSSSLSRRILASTSCVHRRIQSAQGSKWSSTSSLFGSLWSGWCGVEVVLSTSPSSSSSSSSAISLVAVVAVVVKCCVSVLAWSCPFCVVLVWRRGAWYHT